MRLGVCVLLALGALVGAVAVLCARNPVLGLISYLPSCLLTGQDRDLRPVVVREGDTESVRDVVFTHRFVHVTRTLAGDETDVVFHVVQAGNPKNEPVVFAHGFPETWRSWRPHMAQLADRYHVLAFDFKGAGHSSEPVSVDRDPERMHPGGNYSTMRQGDEIVTMLHQLGVDKFNYVSLDLGSFLSSVWVGRWHERIIRYLKAQSTVAVHDRKDVLTQAVLARRYPDAFEALLETCPTHLPRLLMGKTGWPIPSHRAQQRNALPIDDDEFLAVLRDFVHDDGGYHGWIGMYLGFGQNLGDQYFAALRAYRDEYDFPVHIVQGTKDPAQPVWYHDGSVEQLVVDVPDAERTWAEKALKSTTRPVFHKRDVPKDSTQFFPKAPWKKLTFIEGAGHFAHLEAFDRFMETVEELLVVPAARAPGSTAAAA